jgi:hypothetical protein
MARRTEYRGSEVSDPVKTTVICAVWHGDEDRAELVLQHRENLRRQTRPVHVIYIYDNGDVPLGAVVDESVVVGRKLTIYEAWNVALSLVRTPYVANLNLDDRFCRDGIEILENELESSRANLVGGDWEICFSQHEVNRAADSLPVTDFPFFPEWPPAHGVKTRLGSGTGERGTYGPAVLWTMDCHIGFPRYPYRMGDGYLIRSVADSIWWTLLLSQGGRRAVRIPRIIGRYHSRPASQAEFRERESITRLLEKPISLI